jgi:hypothetical protein
MSRLELTLEDDPILLLTATIAPGATPFIHRSDPAIRLMDYKTALVKWLAEPGIATILFCENSGSPLQELLPLAEEFNLHGKKIVFTSYKAPDHEAARGKGYGELGAIRYAISENQLAPLRRILKVTGRYHIGNYDSIAADIRRHKHAALLSCPIHNHALIPSECFVATVHFLQQYFFPRRENINDSLGFYFEHALAESAREAARHGEQHAIFSVRPRIVGVSGTTNLPQSFHRENGSIRILMTPDYRNFFLTVLREYLNGGGPNPTARQAHELYTQLGDRFNQRAANGDPEEEITFRFNELDTVGQCARFYLDYFDKEKILAQTGFSHKAVLALAEAITKAITET